MKKRIASLLLVLILLAATVPSASAAGFADVPKDYWAYKEISVLAERGVVQGNGGKYYPTGTVSRQAFLSMVCRATGLDDRNMESAENWWQPSQTFAHYFNWCSEEEVNEANRSFPITRELAAKLLVKAFSLDQNIDGENEIFSDWSEIGEDYRPYVQLAANLGLIGGYSDGSFRPQATLTRAAAAAIIGRAFALVEQPMGETVQVPILMYHDVSYLGYGYSKTPEIFRQQLEELKNAGFNTVFFSEVIDFVENGTPLPEKPIVITLDDGYMTNYTYVLPILEELDMKAEISVVGNAIIYANWGMRWNHVREMQESGHVRFQAHTKALHNAAGRTGVLKKADESWTDYVDLFATDTESIRMLLARETGIQPQVFTYPLGKHNPMTEAVIRQLGFQASLTTLDGVAKVTRGNPDSLYLMNRIGMDFRNGSVLAVLKQFGYKS